MFFLSALPSGRLRANMAAWPEVVPGRRRMVDLGQCCGQGLSAIVLSLATALMLTRFLTFGPTLLDVVERKLHVTDLNVDGRQPIETADALLCPLRLEAGQKIVAYW